MGEEMDGEMQRVQKCMFWVAVHPHWLQLFLHHLDPTG